MSAVKNVLGRFGSSWRSNRTEITATLLGAGASGLGAITLVPAYSAFLAGGASETQILMFGMTVMTGSVSALAVTIGLRSSATEKALSELRGENAGMKETMDALRAQVVDGTDYELAPDDTALWSRPTGNYRAIRVTLATEVQTRRIKDGLVEHIVNETRLEIWKDRLLSGTMDIMFPKGGFKEEDGVISLRREGYDLYGLVRLLVLLDALSKLNSVDMSKVRIHFSDAESPDLKSVFLTSLRSKTGRVRKAVMLYGNGYLTTNISSRRVAIYYDEEQLSEGNARWLSLSANSTRWTVDQLRNCFRAFLPTGSGKPTAAIPPNFSFDAHSPFQYEKDAADPIVNGDHFVIPRGNVPKRRMRRARNG